MGGGIDPPMGGLDKSLVDCMKEYPNSIRRAVQLCELLSAACKIDDCLRRRGVVLSSNDKFSAQPESWRQLQPSPFRKVNLFYPALPFTNDGGRASLKLCRPGPPGNRNSLQLIGSR
jgi:hypothetical protein